MQEEVNNKCVLFLNILYAFVYLSTIKQFLIQLIIIEYK